MRHAAAAEPRPYHHGDLSRALVDAALRLLERDGPSALSLRAVAREAGVSPAAPYHHFKDKGELLDAVAQQGWQMLNESLARTRAEQADAELNSGLGVTYVRFAREHPALYRVMYDCSRDREALPDHSNDKDSAFCRVRDSLIRAGADPDDQIGLELSAVAAWCAAHGLAEMAAFKQFQSLKDALGGEEAFLRGVFNHMGAITRAMPGSPDET
ncbi:TetR/AcrR family transcriptional regulator [Phenylobacterium sp.]|uniref:TetR/AcrR family transcriptional regulator n=1 Tax=Phenylobacterium sp. TaxID=1871053 RepID=UPI002F41B15E